jgi:ligand-binding sensor domain-containing protein
MYYTTHFLTRSVIIPGIGLLFLLQFSILWSQNNVAFRHISKQDGLSQNSVFAIAQDRHGFMWFGTRDGLNKYDGYRMLVFQHQEDKPQSIISDEVRGLYYDEQEPALWICTPEGLSKYREGQEDFVNYHCSQAPPASQQAEIRCVYRDSNNRLWAGSDKGLYQYYPEQDSFMLFWPSH